MSSVPLSVTQLLALWRSVVDDGYSRPLLELPDSGIEVIEQSTEQWARVSLAVDRTTQAMFVLPWSGQSDDPASGAALASVVLSVTRTTAFEHPLILRAGTRVLHLATDYSDTGPVSVETGLVYMLRNDLILDPGSPGPVTGVADAERPGCSYNDPLPGSITTIEQFGATAHNTGASITLDGVSNHLSMPNTPDVLTPAHVGQYVLMVAGANAGQVRRVVGYSSATPPQVMLDSMAVLFGFSGFFGTPVVGSLMTQLVSGAQGRVIAVSATDEFLLVETTFGTFIPLQTAMSDIAGSYDVHHVERQGQMTPEAGTASWQVLPWTSALGIAVTNLAAPVGGKSAMLDELGGQRGVGRAPGMLDGQYRKLVATPADTICPNAIRRAANRILAPMGESCCLREIGGPLFLGAFADAGSSADLPQHPDVNFAADVDPALWPLDRFKRVMAYQESRGYFEVGVPRLNLDEFGIPADANPVGLENCADSTVPLNFYDGFPCGNAVVQGAVYDAVDRARAGGVSFTLYVEDVGCF